MSKRATRSSNKKDEGPSQKTTLEALEVTMEET